MIRIETQGKLEFTSLILLDNQGKQVREYNVKKRALDISGLAHGVYFLKMQTEAGVAIEKVIIK